MSLPYFPSAISATDLLLGLVLLLGFAALTATIFMRRRRSRRALVERVAELETLSTAGRAIVASELDIDALCELIAEQASQIIDSSTFQVGLFEDGAYDIRFWTKAGKQQPTPQRFELGPGRLTGTGSGGLVGWVLDNGQPLLVGDFETEMDSLPARPIYTSVTPPRSALFIPLISGGQVIGAISAQSDTPHRYSLQDQRRLTILANQAAAGIANAQLYNQERERARHLELVGQIARQVNLVNDPDEIFQQVVDLTQETFGFQPVTVFGLDQATGDMVIRASSIPEIDALAAAGHHAYSQMEGVRLEIGVGIVGTAAATRQTIVANRAADDDRFIRDLAPLPPELAAQTQAEIAIPLIVSDEFLGVLDVQSQDANVFGPSEQTVLEALAAGVAGAIYKAQQLAREQEQAWITTAQLQVAQAISRHPDMEEMMAAVARLSPILTSATVCAFLLWDERSEQYVGSAMESRAGLEDETVEGVSLAIGDWHALDAVHVGRQPLTTNHVPDWLPVSDGRCLRLYPLLNAGEQPLGIMVVDLESAAPCDTDTDLEATILGRRQEELHLSFARQTAQGLESAHLRIAQQEEAWVNTALLQVAEAVSSLNDLNEILNSVVRLVPLLVGVDSVFVLTWNEERQMFQAGPSHGVSAMGRGLVETLEIDRQELLAMSPQLAASFAEPSTRLPAPEQYALSMPAWLETVMGTPNAAGFPLVAQGRLVGAMVIGLPQPISGRVPFSSRRANILNGIAQQAATAVVNNQLYIESAERSRLQQELDVAHNIQASFLPDGSPDIPLCSVASFWQAARQVSGDFYDFMPLSDDRWGIVIADVADKGVGAALFMALSRTIVRTVAFSRDDPAQVLVRANEIIGREAESDLFVTLFYGIYDPATSRLTYANAGHNPPLLMRPNGDFHELTEHGMALGVLPEIQMKSYSIQLHPLDTIVLYTDGVTEALNEDYDEFGLERLQIATRSAASGEATDIVGSITSAVSDHVGETPRFDDMTLVVMKRMDKEQTNGREA